MESRKPRSLFFPMLLVAVGVVLFLTNIGSLNGTSWDILAKYWPAILILGGLDGLYRRDGWIGPIVFLGLGTILLLGNLGYMELNGWRLFLRLWPILIVALGLDLALGKRGSLWGTVGRVALGLLMLAAILWLAMASPFNSAVKTVDLSQKLDGATSSYMEFSLAAGTMSLNAGAEGDLLVGGTASSPRSSILQPAYVAPINGKSTFRLEGPNMVYPSWNDGQLPWILEINKNIPIELLTKLGAGDMTLALNGTHVNHIDSEVGVGKLEVTLPEGQSVDGSLQAAIGEIVVRIPQCADVTIRADTALVGYTLPAGYIRQGDEIRYDAPSGCAANQVKLDLNLAIGSVSIQKMP